MGSVLKLLVGLLLLVLLVTLLLLLVFAIVLEQSVVEHAEGGLELGDAVEGILLACG